MNKIKLAGLVAAAHTPFDDSGALHLAAVEKQAAHFLAHGITTAFIGGSTGECHSLTIDERRTLSHRWFEVIRGTPLRVVVHVGSNCLADARILAAQADQLGAIAISALSPSYFKPPSVACLVEVCASIAAAAPATPFYYYDIPSLTGVNLSMPEFLAQAADRIPTLCGIKYTNADLLAFQRCVYTDDGAFDIPYGTDEWMLAAFALGATGAVGSSFNFAAPIYQRLLAAFATGDLATARMEQYRSACLIALLASYGYMSAAKAVMKMLGVDVGPARLPNPSLTPAQVVKLRMDLEQLDFFNWIGVHQPLSV